MRKYILTLLLISLTSNTAIAQQTADNDSTVTDPFAGWTDEQFEAYNDSIISSITPYNEVITNKAVIENKQVPILRSGNYSNPLVPTTAYINTQKAVGQIEIHSDMTPTGARTYTIPIKGYQIEGMPYPQIALYYNSQAGNGPIGMGWSLSGISQITRSSRNIYYDNMTAGVKMTNDDSFYLDGVRLIRTNTYSDSLIYETEQGNVVAIAYVNGSILKSFKVLYPDGSRAWFGYETNGINQLGYPVTKSVDKNGNETYYSYVYQNSHYRLNAINYNGSSISFTYQNSRPDPITTFSGGKKVYINYLLSNVACSFAGNEIREYTMTYETKDGCSLLKQIDCSAGESELNPLVFYYGDKYTSGNFSSEQSQVTSWYSNPENAVIRKGRFDYFNNYSDGLIVYPFNYAYYRIYKKGGTFSHTKNYFVNCYDGTENIYIYPCFQDNINLSYPLQTEEGFIDILCADLYGKVEDCIVKVNNTVSGNYDHITFKIYCKNITTGLMFHHEASFNFSTVHTDNDGNKSVQPKHYYTGDFNGDGKMEILAVSAANTSGETNRPSKCYIFDLVNNVKLYEGQVFTFNETFVGTNQTDPEVAQNQTDRLFVIDYDGDGKSDICHIDANGLHIYTFTQSGSTWSYTSLPVNTSLNRNSLPNRHLLPCELNGDGLTDFLLSPSHAGTSTAWTAYESKGDGAYETTTKTGPSVLSSYKYFMQDINNDGKSELICQSASYFFTYSIETSTITICSSSSITEQTGIVPVDINSHNHFARLAAINGSGQITSYLYDKNARNDLLLTGMQNSNGVIERNRYVFACRDYGINNFYSRGYDATYPYVNLEEAIQVLAEDETYLKGTTVDNNQYHYSNAVAHLQGLGFRGFSGMTRYNRKGQAFVSNYDPYNNSVLTQESSPTHSKSYTYTHSVASNKIRKDLLTQADEQNLLTGIGATSTMQYDSYGNLTNRVTSYSDGLTNTNLCSYYNNPQKRDGYYIGRCYQQEVIRWRIFDTSSEKTVISSFNAKGLPTSVVKFVDSNQVSSEELTYNNQGQVLTSTVKRYSSNDGHTSTLQYDTYGRITSKTDYLGQTETYTYNSLGHLCAKIDNLGGTYTYTYDDFGRQIAETRPDGTSLQTTRVWSYGDNLYGMETTETGKPFKTVYYDALNRESGARETVMNMTAYTEKAYDTYGRLASETLPHEFGSSASVTTYTYDLYDRILSVSEPSGKLTTYTYDGTSMTTTSNGESVTMTTDSQGNVIYVDDPAGTITYTLRADGKPETIESPGSIFTDISYDSYGRRTSFNDPSLGSSTYQYDGEGNLSSETYATGATVSYSYNQDNLMDGKQTPEFTTNYLYDTKCRLISATSTNSTSKSYTYDTVGRISSVRENAPDGKWLQRDYTYSDGNISTITYTSQSGVLTTENYTYINGRLYQITLSDGKIVYRVNSMNILGQPTTIYTGSIRKKDDYNLASGLLEFVTADRLSNTVYVDKEYYYDNTKDNISQIIDNLNRPSDNFTYDSLDRLTATDNDTITYDVKGNILQKTSVGIYSYTNTSKPYAVTGISPTGNAIPTEGQDITYSSFWRPATISEGIHDTSFEYNDQYNRTRMTLQRNDTTILTRYYLGDCYEQDVTSGSNKERLYLGGDYYSAYAVLIKDSVSGTSNVYHILRDHLGSITHVIDNSGNVVQELSYDAWGRLRDPDTHVVYAPDSIPELFLGRGYTGHEHLNQYGLINMNARLYDPTLGRFLSPDKYVQETENSQNFNRYSYCLNNPLRYKDENGELFFFTIFNAIKDLLVNTFVKVWSQGFNAWSDGRNWHSTAMAYKIDMGMFKGNIKQVLSRFTWELPQTLLGQRIGSIQNTFYGVKSVSYYGGATAIEYYAEEWGAFTLGSYVNGERGLHADPGNWLFQHEYGHYLQSQSVGPFYLQRYGIPSLLDKMSDSDHDYHTVEQDANIRALKYFYKHVPDYLIADDGDLDSFGWHLDKNPIIGFDRTQSLNSYTNQLALRRGILSLGWIDYLYGPSIITPGLYNSLLLKQ